MRSIQLLCACLALTLLAACDKDAPSQPKAPPAPPPMSTGPEPTPPATEPAAPVEPPPAPEPKSVPPPPVPTPNSMPSLPAPAKPKEPPEAATAAAPAAPLPKAKLDLSLPKDMVDQLQPSEVAADLPDRALLPQMFVEKPAPESPFQLNGKLITNEREDDYWRSVEGAELQFEFKR